MSDEVALRKQVTVVVTGHLPDKTTVFQMITLQCDAGTPSATLIANAFNIIRGFGVLSTSSADNEQMDIYPLSKFDRINFAVKPIQLATGLAL